MYIFSTLALYTAVRNTCYLWKIMSCCKCCKKLHDTIFCSTTCGEGETSIGEWTLSITWRLYVQRVLSKCPAYSNHSILKCRPSSLMIILRASMSKDNSFPQHYWSTGLFLYQSVCGWSWKALWDDHFGPFCNLSHKFSNLLIGQ